MNASTDFFGVHGDWLAHTLAEAGKAVSELRMELDDGTRVTRHGLGLLSVRPAAGVSATEAMIVSAGIHGNETAPIEVLNALVAELLAGHWQARNPLLLILGNPAAMVAGERFVDVNLNRLFNGAHAAPEYAQSPEGRRAAELETLCSTFAADYSLPLSHYDLHTAIRPSVREKFALYPFNEGRRPPMEQREFLLEAGIGTLLLQHRKGTTFSAFTTSSLGAESFTLELGKVQPFGHNDLQRFSAVEHALRRRFKGEAPSHKERGQPLETFQVVQEILNTGPSFRFHVPDDVPNFTSYPPGTVIWEDSQTVYRVGERPESIVFPNPAVPVGQRVGLLIRPCGEAGG
ncbi:succinylglutamate desuccinylase [Gilvimarinus sp. F26214L]|uniref:succinylglutamate desuccinylase n=1 Tax=Gilvimarinus sp. DZF01 TaxID=3461371 RepID=UPI004045E591